MSPTETAELEIKPTAVMRMRVMVTILLAIFFVLLLVYLLSGGGADFFAQRATFTTYMPEATGLTEGSEVRLSGIRIGKVKKLGISGSLDPRRAVEVQARILKRYLKSIPADSQTAISTDTLVGTAFLDIQEGQSTATLADGGVLQSEPLNAAIDRADMVRVLTNNLRQVDQILAQVESGQTSFGKFLRRDSEYRKILSGIGDFDRTIRSTMNPGSQAGQVFFSSRLYDQIRSSVLRVDDALLAVQRGEGVTGKLFASDQQYNDILRQLTDLHATLAAVNSGKGGASALLQNEEAYRKISSMLAATDAMLDSLNKGNGRAAQLLANPQLYESLNGSLRAMQDLLRDYRENPRKYMRIKVF